MFHLFDFVTFLFQSVDEFIDYAFGLPRDSPSDEAEPPAPPADNQAPR
ncbi:MAG: hypothetical protein ABIP81_01930 [Terriglobales bacterium]